MTDRNERYDVVYDGRYDLVNGWCCGPGGEARGNNG